MSTTWRIVCNAQSNKVILRRAKWCDSFWLRFRGLQFVRDLPEDEGLFFVDSRESRTNTTIHMFFMWFSIGVVWLDSTGKVVDTCLAKPWRPAYAPKVAAQYFIEARPSILEQVKVGDRLRFDEVAR